MSSDWFFFFAFYFSINTLLVKILQCHTDTHVSIYFSVKVAAGWRKIKVWYFHKSISKEVSWSTMIKEANLSQGNDLYIVLIMVTILSWHNATKKKLNTIITLSSLYNNSKQFYLATAISQTMLQSWIKIKCLWKKYLEKILWIMFFISSYRLSLKVTINDDKTHIVQNKAHYRIK